MGRVLRENDDDFECIEGQLRKARARWNGIAKILKREGANAKTMAKFYLTIVQALLLYGSESWVISEKNMRKLESFHKRAVRYMTGSHIRKKGEEWEYPDHRILLLGCGLLPMKTYIERRRGTLWKYLKENRKELLEEAGKSVKHSRDVNKILWWEQSFLTREEMSERTNIWFKK